MDRLDRHIIYSLCPIVRRETVKLARIVSVDGLAPADHILRFEREVLWIRETETTALTIMNGHTLNEGPTHNDFYGLFNSVKDVIFGATAFAEAHGMTVGGDPRRECRLTVTERPVLAQQDDDRSQRGRMAYLLPPKQWCIDDEMIPLWLEEEAKPWGDEGGRNWDVRLTRLTGQVAQYVVWRSDFDTAANDELLATARAAIVPVEAD